jgi:hypothetical protein
MSKMTVHEPFGRLHARLWAKERPGIKTASLRENESRPLKVGDRPDLLGCSDVQHIVGKLSRRAPTLLLTSSRSKVCKKTYTPSKSWESCLAGFRDSHAGVPGQKAIWMPAPWRVTEYTIRGKVVASPQVRAVVSLVCPCCPWLVLAPKVLQLCTNYFVWLVCRPV